MTRSLQKYHLIALSLLIYLKKLTFLEFFSTKTLMLPLLLEKKSKHHIIIFTGPSKCSSGVADIGFVVDSSYSIGGENGKGEDGKAWRQVSKSGFITKKA